MVVFGYFTGCERDLLKKKIEILAFEVSARKLVIKMFRSTTVNDLNGITLYSFFLQLPKSDCLKYSLAQKS